MDYKFEKRLHGGSIEIEKNAFVEYGAFFLFIAQGGADMLEFPESFFEQEIREGFYLDTTMKTLWAAELELLQKVAEVCDKYGLKWFAACGTLLGAIRHEGFVPWDDDMDIWMIRNDYNTLMKVLPKELPEDYHVRSPLTEEGYDQFHTCVNNGSGISIAKDWLERNHNCPFTVGLDIFPLDYLPRNEADRELQKNLFTLAGRVAQVAKQMARGDYDAKEGETEEEVQARLQYFKQEMEDGIVYLKESCKLPINQQLLEEEKWYDLSSEMWKWANHIAMMYNEDEADVLVGYVDYTLWEFKKFPKEWFAETYAASFENFMIPIPAGYDHILELVYGDYMVIRKKTGTHEYPFYARQLRQLREYVKNVEQRMIDTGIVSIDDMEIKEQSVEIPDQWIRYLSKENGRKKSVVLSANDVNAYMRNGESALNQLEEMLRYFERVKDSVVLWWRPQAVMEKQLLQVSSELAARYRAILEDYKERGWGICDETDNIERAVKACDCYYGNMNAILQPFQNANKPIVLVDPERSAMEKKADNYRRILESKAFLSISDYVRMNNRLYFANTNYNALVIVNENDWKVEQLIPFEGEKTCTENIHLRCIQRQNKICFLPAGSSRVHIYDLKRQCQFTCDFLEKTDSSPRQGSWDYFCQKDHVFLMPSHENQGLWEWIVSADALERQDWWSLPQVQTFLQHGSINESSFYTLSVESNRLFITDVLKHTIESYILPDECVLSIVYDGSNFWYTAKNNYSVVCWNTMSGIVERYWFPDIFRKQDIFTYSGIWCEEGNFFLFSQSDQSLYWLDMACREIKSIFTFNRERGSFSTWDMTPRFKRVGQKLICFFRNAGELIEINLETMSVEQYCEQFQTGKDILNWAYSVTLNRNALLFEEQEVGLDLLLQHCIDGCGQVDFNE